MQAIVIYIFWVGLWASHLHAADTIIAFGDSTTAPRGKLTVYASCLAGELKKNGRAVRVINAGVGGHNTDMARRRFQKDVLAREPDVVIIQFGINDAAVDVWRKPPATKPRVSLARYEANLMHFVKTLKARDTKVILMTPNPMRWTPRLRQLYGKPPYKAADADGFNVLLNNYAAAVRRIGESQKVPVADVYAAFQAYDQRVDQSMDDLLLDGMHPNNRGQQIVCGLLMKKLVP
jgi:lysophospholipase L1-like esterase